MATCSMVGPWQTHCRQRAAVLSLTALVGGSGRRRSAQWRPGRAVSRRRARHSATWRSTWPRPRSRTKGTTRSRRAARRAWPSAPCRPRAPFALAGSRSCGLFCLVRPAALGLPHPGAGPLHRACVRSRACLASSSDRQQTCGPIACLPGSVSSAWCESGSDRRLGALRQASRAAGPVRAGGPGAGGQRVRAGAGRRAGRAGGARAADRGGRLPQHRRRQAKGNPNLPWPPA